ncbi:MAG: WD40 repeat domain-containing protein, partial [Planctomycetales bacterium]
MRFLFRLVACLVFLSPLLGLWWLESGSPGQPNRVLPEGEKLLGVYPQALAVLTVKQTSGESPRFTLWDVGSQKQRAFGEDLGVLDPAPSRAAKGDQFSKHGRVWATRNGSQVALWNVWQSKSLGAVTVRENAAEPFALSYDGSVLAYLDAQQQEVRVRDVEQQAEQCRIPASVASVALSPYGKMVAAPGAGSTVNLLHASSGEPLTVLPGGARPPRVMRFSSSGRFLAAAIAPDPNDMKSETEIVLWDVAEKRTILATRASASQVSSIRFSHEDSLLR